MRISNLFSCILCFILLTSVIISFQALANDVNLFNLKKNAEKFAENPKYLSKSDISFNEANKIATFKIFKSKEEAERFAEKLKKEGFEVVISTDTTEDKKIVYKVFAKKPKDSSNAAFSSVEVEQKQKLLTGESDKLQPPLILSPEGRSEFRDTTKITFIWREVPNVAAYHFILARDRTFKNIIHENAKVTGTSYTVENLDYGTYFLKIGSLSSDGTEEAFSDILTFVIVPPPPSKIPLL